VTDPLHLDELRAAAAIVHDVVPPTPVLHSDELDRAIDPSGGSSVWCKADALQRAGSFKFRGAYRRLSAIAPEDRSRGVVAVSSGNHGAAIACAAEMLGMPAVVFIPDDAPAVKRDLILGFGAQIVTFPRDDPDRETPARSHAARTGATFVHPFEDRLVMAGQGTCALELIDEVGELDVLVVPMSGGGLMAGCASAATALRPGCVVVGVEPSAADDTRRSFAAGHPVRIAQPSTIADGLAVTAPGPITFAINRQLVSDVVTVDEDDIVEAMRLIAATLDLLVEPSGAVGIAAVATNPGRWSGRIGVILSGGNVDRTRWGHLLPER
jgi:threonine dehydratase